MQLNLPRLFCEFLSLGARSNKMLSRHKRDTMESRENREAADLKVGNPVQESGFCIY